MNRFLSKPLSLIIGCLIVATSLCACRGNEVENVDLKSIRDCKELEVAEFHFHKIIVEKSTVSALGIAGFGLASFPERTLILPVDVTVVGKIDFKNFVGILVDLANKVYIGAFIVLAAEIFIYSLLLVQIKILIEIVEGYL